MRVKVTVAPQNEPVTEKTMQILDGRMAGHSALCALSLVLSLMLIEPKLGRVERLGDLLESEQYLFIAPTGELAYFIPVTRRVSTSWAAAVSLPLFLLGLIPAASRVKKKGLDFHSAAGLTLMSVGLFAMGAEYAAKREWVLAGRIGARYLAMSMVSVGAFLICRDRRFLAALGAGGFTWDLSSALFWAYLSGSPGARVPVPWRHHFGDEEAMGAPCWQVALLDAAAIRFFVWIDRSRFDPLRLFAG